MYLEFYVNKIILPEITTGLPPIQILIPSLHIILGQYFGRDIFRVNKFYNKKLRDFNVTHS
jgi:hypothetical protein